jgi:hypothetical protein
MKKVLVLLLAAGAVAAVAVAAGLPDIKRYLTMRNM